MRVNKKKLCFWTVCEGLSKGDSQTDPWVFEHDFVVFSHSSMTEIGVRLIVVVMITVTVTSTVTVTVTVGEELFCCGNFPNIGLL